MKKFAKMSLVAALAITGTVASAQPLAEAIKNVDVSGTVVYRYNDSELHGGVTANDSSHSYNNYKIGLNLASKVNDDVTANTRFLVESFGMDTSNTPDSNVNVQLSEVNFTYTGVENLAVTVGKQGVATPFTVHRDAMGTESTGTGVLAAYNVGPVTLAGAYFNQTNISYKGATALNGTNVAALAVMGSFAGINADAWYLDVADTLDAYTLGLNANYEVSGVSLSPSIRYSEVDEDANNDDIATLKVSMRASMGMFNAYLAYAKTDDQGGVSIDGLSSSVIADDHWNVWLADQADSDIYFANIGAQVTDTVAVSLHYSDLDRPTGANDKSEIYGQVVYNMSKNLSTYVRFGEIDEESLDKETAGRLHVQYSF